MIDLKGSEITIEGPFFEPGAKARFRENLYDAVEEVTKRGAAWAREGVRPRNPTGFTGGMIEPYVQRRTLIGGGGSVGTLYGKVRMRPGLTRGGSATYPATRVPYIVAAVLETGTYRGHPRRGLRYLRKAATKMRAYVRSIKADLARGLN